MKEKICPIMSQGFIIAYFAKSTCHPDNMEIDLALKDQAPKCLEENCALWIGYNSRDAGHCGLKN